MSILFASSHHTLVSSCFVRTFTNSLSSRYGKQTIHSQKHIPKRCCTKWLRMTNKEGEDKSGFENEKDKQDWDESWTNFNQRQQRRGEVNSNDVGGGGVFKFASSLDQQQQQRQDTVEDKRVEDLTNAWSNESGFLYGIAIIVLIGMFYVYVYATGGITTR